MDNLYIKEYDMKSSDFDKFDHIRLSSVLELFQDAAGRHAQKIGAGREEMEARSYFWVLVKIKFQIISKPGIDQKVIVKTWPLPPNKFIYRREYRIEDENGDALIIGSTEWVVMNSEKRRLVSAPDLYSLEGGFHQERNFEEKIPKTEDFESNNPPYIICPRFSDIDTNNHVNNTKYANFVLDAVNPDEDFETEIFQIDYRREVLCGSILNIYTTNNDNVVLAKGLNDNGDLMFSCKIICKYK